MPLSPSARLTPPTVTNTETPLTRLQAILLHRLTRLGESRVRGRFIVTGNRETGHIRIKSTDEASDRLLWSIRMGVDARHAHPTLALFNRYRVLFPLTLTPDYSEDTYWRAAQLNNFLRGFREDYRSPAHQQALARYNGNCDEHTARRGNAAIQADFLRTSPSLCNPPYRVA